MKIWTNYYRVAVLVAAVTLPAFSQAQEDKPPQQDQKQVRVRLTRVEEDSEDGEKKLGFTVEVKDPAMSKYWIGVMCEDLESELVKSQLRIDSGVSIEDVLAGGPAEKAGLKKYDILAEVDGKPLDGLPMLGKCIAESQGAELQLTVIRNGDRLQIALAPAERPEDLQSRFPPQAKDDPRAADEDERILKALEVYGFGGKDAGSSGEGNEKGRMSLHYFLPGFVVPGEAKDFPENLEVTVTKASGKPTKVVVKRGDEKWEVDEENLDKLPEDIRPHIQRMLGGGDQFGWSPKPMIVPELESIPQFNVRQFKFAPDLNLKLEKKLGHLQWKMSEDVRQKVEQRLNELQEKVEGAQAGVDRRFVGTDSPRIDQVPPGAGEAACRSRQRGDRRQGSGGR